MSHDSGDEITFVTSPAESLQQLISIARQPADPFRIGKLASASAFLCYDAIKVLHVTRLEH